MKPLIHKLKVFLRKNLPEWMFYIWHFGKAALAAMWYGFPSKNLFMIGVTGTKGKTSTANFIWSVLDTAGFKAGQLGTASIRIGKNQMLNRFHMTMPSPFKIQKLLRQMSDEDCTHVVMEATSEGMKLFRHVGIKFNAAVFTNLTPEHLPSHGGDFEKYKAIKARLIKNLNGEKIIIANADSEYANFYLSFPAGKKITFGLRKGDLQALHLSETAEGVNFTVNEKQYHLSILGGFNVYNALPAIALGQILGIGHEQIKMGLANLIIIEGRMQKIDEGQKFTAIVDYAHEKVSMNALLDTARNIAGDKQRIIVLLGAEGGGRDKSKRAAMGEAAGKKADFVICSNVDPYDDDPTPIVEDIARASEQFGKIRNENLFVIEDRRAGIVKALRLAQAGDIVLITGKGAEQTMLIGNKAIAWDDREVVREELKKL